MALWLIRHGETEWSRSGRHTGRTDLPLTYEGELQAVAIGKLLEERTFERVVSSPSKRAADTARLAGFGQRLEIDEELAEVDYGEYEGLTTLEIQERAPGWELFRDGGPGGETPQRIVARADELIATLEEGDANTLVFGHGHRFRSVAARYLSLPLGVASQLRLDAGAISVLAPQRDGPSIVLWNRRVPARAVIVADIAVRVPDIPG
jgi:broad specificity phosphatase PhoE